MTLDYHDKCGKAETIEPAGLQRCGWDASPVCSLLRWQLPWHWPRLPWLKMPVTSWATKSLRRKCR